MIAEVLIEQAVARTGLVCDRVGEDIAAFIDAEQAGVATSDDDQAIAQHIALCPHCAEIYATTRQVLHAQAQGELPSWPTSRSQVPPPLASQVTPLIVPHDEIQRTVALLRERVIVRSRSSDAREQQLVLGSHVPGQAHLFVRILLEAPPDVHATEHTLIIALSGPGVLADRAVIVEHRNERRMARTNAQGQASLPAIPSSWIDDPASDFLLTIQ